MRKDNFSRFKKSPDFKALLTSVGAYENIDLSNVPEDIILGDHHHAKVGRRQRSMQGAVPPAKALLTAESRS